MILECKSCSKKFLVPDSAIPANGRLVQCSSCGNKWTQFPIKKTKPIKIVDKKPPVKSEKNIQKLSKKPKTPKPRTGPSIYSKEYLKQKHGIVIGFGKEEKSDNNKKIKITTGINFGFYSYLIFLLFFIISVIGILNLTKEILIYNFPVMESYVNYLFENIDNFSIMIKDLFNSY